MNIFLYILQMLIFAVFTFCCDCQLNNFQWKTCFPDQVRSLKLELFSKISPNCASIDFNGTAGHNLGKITSATVEAEGILSGFPVVTYTEPYACVYTKPKNGEVDEVFFVRNFMPTLCTKLGDGGEFAFEMPLNEDEQQLFTTITGPFKIRVSARHINNARQYSDCYDFSGTVDCVFDDYD